MSGERAGNVFDRYGKRYERPAPEAEPLPSSSGDDGVGAEADKARYQAVFADKSKTQTRLRLHYRDGLTVRLLNYAYLLEVMSTSHRFVSLIFSSTVVTLKGRHLDRLLEELQDERVRALVCFHPGRFEAPEEGESCILEMKDVSLHEVGST
ncbi:MAG: hypothetical protein R3A44_38370 [Caldilineaceae bacterium]